jgi:methylenetetrahydrofolate reductase (NADPH)
MSTGNTAADWLNNYSIEMTAKDVPQLEAAADIIPQGTKIPVTFLPGETFEMRIAAAKRVRELGFLPIPHISARRLQSQSELESYLDSLQREVGTDHAFVVAGDPPQPLGPFEDALSIIRSGLLATPKAIPKSAMKSCGRRSGISKPRSSSAAMILPLLPSSPSTPSRS